MERVRRRMEKFMEYSVENRDISKYLIIFETNMEEEGKKRKKKQTRRSFREKFRGECSYDEITRGEKN